MIALETRDTRSMSPEREGRPEISRTEDTEARGEVRSTCIVGPVVLAVLSVGQLRGGDRPEVDDGQEESPAAQHQGGQAVGGGVDGHQSQQTCQCGRR